MIDRAFLLHFSFFWEISAINGTPGPLRTLAYGGRHGKLYSWSRVYYFLQVGFSFVVAHLVSFFSENCPILTWRLVDFLSVDLKASFVRFGSSARMPEKEILWET